MEYVTIKDVAKKLGVAPSTVSRAFNDASDISKKTRARILKEARAMGYRPNPVARHLHLRKTFQVGVVIPEFVNDFFPRVIIGMQESLQAVGYQLLIMQSNECYQSEMDNVRRLEENMVDGLMVSLSSETLNISHYNELYKQGMPMVFFNRVNEQIKAPKVVFNDFKWSCLAVEHLIHQGCRNLIHLAGYKHLSLSRERIRGFRKALEKHQLPYNTSRIVETGFTIEEGEGAMQRLLQDGAEFDGLFAANDPSAMGAIRVLKEHGYRIPQQVKVMGFSESRWAALVEPPLSTVCQPTLEMGRVAARLLLEQMKGNKTNANTHTLNGELVVRASSQLID